MRRLSFGIGGLGGRGLLGLAGLLALAAAPGAALANEDAGKEFFQRMDGNGDGKISRDEHDAAARTMFEKMDADKDGRVTATEMDAAREQIVGKKGMKAMKGKGAMSSSDKIKVIDTDGDGVLSADEHAGGATTMFDKMDTDGDGLLTKAELEAGHDKLMKKAPRK